MAYKRDDAVKYAAKHWNIPCDDGVFWLSNERISVEAKRKQLKASAADGWQPKFVQGLGSEPEIAVFERMVGGVKEQKLINGWDGLADCAHYLSRCLTTGGAKIDERGVTGLVNTLQARADTKTLCERTPRAGAQRVINSGIFKPGDMIGYFNIDPSGDYDGAKRYTHSTMYVGKLDARGDGGVTCHTVARFPPHSWVNDSWWLKDGAYTYTLIHFTADDPTPDATKAAKLAGWWKLDYSGRTEYYYIFKDGRARYANKPPKSTKTPMAVSDGSAYWFMDSAGKVTFIWRASGTVEIWSPAIGGGKEYSSMINSGIPGVVTRL
jgi:hypothetical protein